MKHASHLALLPILTSYYALLHLLSLLSSRSIWPCSHIVISIVDDGLPQPSLMYSVTKVVGLPQVCGLTRNNNMVVEVLGAATNYNELDIWSLIDGRANICITGLLDLLVEVVLIPLLPISVATKKGGISLDDCCTKRGLLPLTLANGSIYY
jgi:hypothetical protein